MKLAKKDVSSSNKNRSFFDDKSIDKVIRRREILEV